MPKLRKTIEVKPLSLKVKDISYEKLKKIADRIVATKSGIHRDIFEKDYQCSTWWERRKND